MISWRMHCATWESGLVLGIFLGPTPASCFLLIPRNTLCLPSPEMLFLPPPCPPPPFQTLMLAQFHQCNLPFFSVPALAFGGWCIDVHQSNCLQSGVKVVSSALVTLLAHGPALTQGFLWIVS